MISEKVYSPTLDKNIYKDIDNSPIWKRAYKSEEIHDIHEQEYYEYTVKFDGLTPVFVTNIKRIKKKNT